MYDDNYGYWDSEDGWTDGERREFYEYTQKNSVWKNCGDCGERVKIMPHYAICNSCADKRERGWAW
jgi:hypothetical protein